MMSGNGSNSHGFNVSNISANGSISSGSNVSNSSGLSAGVVTSIPCGPFNDDTCLRASPFWDTPGATWSCTSSVRFCAIWAKDMQRCCSLACGTVYLTQDSCTHNGNLGTCVYPHHGSSDCGGTVMPVSQAGVFSAGQAGGAAPVSAT